MNILRPIRRPARGSACCALSLSLVLCGVAYGAPAWAKSPGEAARAKTARASSSTPPPAAHATATTRSTPPAIALAAASPKFRRLRGLGRGAQASREVREVRADWIGRIGTVKPRRALSPTARDAVDRGAWPEAFRALKAMKPDPKREPFLTFLAAYAAVRADEYDAAHTWLTALQDRAALLGDYVAWLRAEVAFAQSRFDAAAKQASYVPSNSPMRQRSVFLRANALARAQSVEADEAARAQKRTVALSAMDDAVRIHKRASRAAPLAAQLAAEYAALKQWGDAARVYAMILRDHPLSSEATIAQRQLAALGPKLPKAQRAQLEAGWFDRVMARQNALYRAHRSKDVVKEGAALLKGKTSRKLFKPGSEARCKLEYQIAHSYTKLRKHKQSVPWYARVIKGCAATAYHARALFKGARGSWNADNHKQAIKWFAQLAREHAAKTIADDAMYFQARILRELKREKEATAMLRAQVAAYPTGDMVKDAHWLLIRDLFRRKKYAEVVAYVAKVKHAGESDVYSQGRLAYFAARAQELRKKRADATKRYAEVARAYPMGYYALLSLNRLGALKRTANDQDICAKTPRQKDSASVCTTALGAVTRAPSDAPALPDALRDDKNFKRGVLLLQLKLDSLAGKEFRRLRYRYREAPDTLWALATLLDASGFYTLSHDIPRRVLKGWQDYYPGGATDARWSVAYPTPFEPKVRRWAKARGLRPALVWAIMREESGFRPRIESWANARGLLQLIKPTARGMARKDRLKGYTFDRMFEPEVNIRLGTAYMKDLSDRFGGQEALVIAGYNGGHANVQRWLTERGTLPFDLWVEDIPYGQTRKYTKRVLTSFWAYSWLYGDARVPVVSFDLPNPV